MKTCPFCGKETREYETVDLFQYGADEDGVILEAAVIVQTCDDCDTGWTYYRGEDARQAAIEEHLARKN